VRDTHSIIPSSSHGGNDIGESPDLAFDSEAILSAIPRILGHPREQAWPVHFKVEM
jgi:hypothetical protein